MQQHKNKGNTKENPKTIPVQKFCIALYVLVLAVATFLQFNEKFQQEFRTLPTKKKAALEIMRTAPRDYLENATAIGGSAANSYRIAKHAHLLDPYQVAEMEPTTHSKTTFA